MIRSALILSVLTFVFTLLLPTSGAFTGPGAAQADLLQCMEKCIRTNGKDEKDSCKLSCSANMSFKNQAKDCMAIYQVLPQGLR